MKTFLGFAALFCLVVISTGANSWNKEHFVEKWYNANAIKLMSLVSQPQMPQRYLTGKENFYQTVKKNHPILQFSWSNCGKTDDPVQINKLAISPDPIHLPGDLTVSFDASTSVNVTSPLQVDITIQKKVAFWWVEIPCLDGQGSCSYDDFCTQLPADCPPAFIKNNIPCHCPVAQGKYALSDAVISLPSLPLPGWASNGDYKASLTGHANGQELFCINVALTLD